MIYSYISRKRNIVRIGSEMQYNGDAFSAAHTTAAAAAVSAATAVSAAAAAAVLAAAFASISG